MSKRNILLKKVRVHNLKEVDLELNGGELIAFSGVSGSGKSSLAFDTIFTEGQRRYVESLSTYARRRFGDLPKPDADSIEGISPTIAIEQKSAGRNPRSSVGTMTGIYDLLRILFARVGSAHCPISGEPVTPQSVEQIIEEVQSLDKDIKAVIYAPFVRGKKGEFKDEFEDLIRKGFSRIRLDGKLVDLEEEISIDPKVSHDIDLLIDRLVINPKEKQRIAEACQTALRLGNGMLVLVDMTNERELLFSQHAYSPKSGKSYPPLQPQDFSFNHPQGMCETCQGLGVKKEFDLDLIIDSEKSIAEDCCSIASSYQTVRYGNIYDNLATLYHFDIDTPWKDLPKKAKDVFLNGIKKKWTRMQFVHPTKGTKWTDYVSWKGVLFEAHRRYAEAKSDLYRRNTEKLMSMGICPTCQGSRIKLYPAATQIAGKTIAQITAMPIGKSLPFFQKMKFAGDKQKIAKELLKEIITRLDFLNDVGLDYLSLERSAPTLSGGESQRVRLAAQIGIGLVGATYVLDEPSIGLHARDNEKLLATLRLLQQKGNTVIVVEHDEDTLLAADQIVDVGPGAGSRGGEILSDQTLSSLLQSPRSITGAYLLGKKTIPLPKKRRKKGKESLCIREATHHNLKKLSVDIPLGLFVAVTGVSGSGKSSLISDILYPALSNELHHAKLPVGKCQKIEGIEHIDKVIAIDQTPIGRTPRSNPATYIKVFDEIRSLFSKLPESSAFGFQAGRFSFNVKEGSCPHCSGMGMVRIDMDFLEDEWVTCPECGGERFDQQTLSIRYRGKNIHEVLEMTVEEALAFFEAIPSIARKLSTLDRIGLSYMKIGQPSPTLSGGEAQRIKLAKELSRPSTGKTLYILDEPTTGLHFNDVHNLLTVLNSLVDKNNSVIVIEHNLDLIKTADWILDLGPEGGDGGGELISEGTPEQLSTQTTHTGKALAKTLTRVPPKIEKKKKSVKQTIPELTVEGAAQHNLRSIDATIPRGKITLCSGPSGSGKTSLAFDTIYAEGQRRYVESLSPYIRQFVQQMPKAQYERIEGLSPAIAIEQKKHAGNPRSTVGTMTEIYDYLRVLYARLGTAYCPETKEKIEQISPSLVLDKLLTLPEKSRLQILAPLPLRRSDTIESVIDKWQKLGYLRLRLNNKVYEFDEEIPFSAKEKNDLYLVIDRILLSSKSKRRLLEAIEKAAEIGNNQLVVATEKEDLFFNLAFAVPSTGRSYPPITPHTFSFNTAQGMCPSCTGLGFQYGANLQNKESVLAMSSWQLVLELWKEYAFRDNFQALQKTLVACGIDPEIPIEELSEEQKKTLFEGSSEDILLHKGISGRWIGINPALAIAAKHSDRETKDHLLPLLDKHTCPTCSGSRLAPLGKHVLLNKLSLPDLCARPLNDVESFIKKLDHKDPGLKEVFSHIEGRLAFLLSLGLHYLSLDRAAPTLSGGETQRIHLARQLGSGLTGCLYVLDEPTIGLHPHNNALLNENLKKLAALGNTLLLVEHDPMTMAISDYVLDFGPGAGSHGGQIVSRGTLSQIKQDPNSPTGRYLSGREKITPPEKLRSSDTFLTISNASLHNLRSINTSFPKGCLTCVTGISGSGKSSLLSILQKGISQGFRGRKLPPPTLPLPEGTIENLNLFDKAIVIDQNPIGHTIRADISTYTDLLSPLRSFFAELPTAKARGLLPRHFSANHRRGMCTTCQGLGHRTIELQFLPPVKVTCESCHGYRLNPLTLSVTYKDKHLGEILSMTIREALDFLPPHPKIIRLLETLIAVGLDYLSLNREIQTLSGGEAQRLRLSKELAKRSTGKTLFLLDEPTVGLHFSDTAKLISILHQLVDKGNTVITIEHNLDILSQADWIVDLGPLAGIEGGDLIYQGPPTPFLSEKKSLTAPYLSSHLDFLHQS